MKNLYIIGNGFDKHHEVPSGYWDFHKWLKEKNPELVEQIDELYGYSDDLWGNFEVELATLIFLKLQASYMLKTRLTNCPIITNVLFMQGQ